MPAWSLALTMGGEVMYSVEPSLLAEGLGDTEWHLEGASASAKARLLEWAECQQLARNMYETY